MFSSFSVQQLRIFLQLIQFLVTLVGDRTLSGMKRKFPLMLHDAASDKDVSVPTKIPRIGDKVSDRQSRVPPEVIRIQKVTGFEFVLFLAIQYRSFVAV